MHSHNPRCNINYGGGCNCGFSLGEPRALASAGGSVSFPDWLLQKTFVIQYNPNCYKKWLVRMPGKSAILDLKPYVTKETGDALGFGFTLDEAAKECLTAYEALKQNPEPCGGTSASADGSA